MESYSDWQQKIIDREHLQDHFDELVVLGTLLGYEVIATNHGDYFFGIRFFKGDEFIHYRLEIMVNNYSTISEVYLHKHGEKSVMREGNKVLEVLQELKELL